MAQAPILHGIGDTIRGGNVELDTDAIIPMINALSSKVTGFETEIAGLQALEASINSAYDKYVEELE